LTCSMLASTEEKLRRISEAVSPCEGEGALHLVTGGCGCGRVARRREEKMKTKQEKKGGKRHDKDRRPKHKPPGRHTRT